MQIKEEKTPFNQFRQKQEQEKIKEKYDIVDTSKVVVVEKNNTVKFIINLLINIGKTILYISLIALAFIGVIALILPECRNEILFQLKSIWEQFINFTGIGGS